MNIYNIKIYHDKTFRMATFSGWEFPDKFQARGWGEQMARTIYEVGPSETKVYVEWMKEVE